MLLRCKDAGALPAVAGRQGRRSGAVAVCHARPALSALPRPSLPFHQGWYACGQGHCVEGRCAGLPTHHSIVLPCPARQAKQRCWRPATSRWSRSQATARWRCWRWVHFVLGLAAIFLHWLHPRIGWVGGYGGGLLCCVKATVGCCCCHCCCSPTCRMFAPVLLAAPRTWPHFHAFLRRLRSRCAIYHAQPALGNSAHYSSTTQPAFVRRLRSRCAVYHARPALGNSARANAPGPRHTARRAGLAPTCAWAAAGRRCDWAGAHSAPRACNHAVLACWLALSVLSAEACCAPRASALPFASLAAHPPLPAAAVLSRRPACAPQPTPVFRRARRRHMAAAWPLWTM